MENYKEGGLMRGREEGGKEGRKEGREARERKDR